MTIVQMTIIMTIIIQSTVYKRLVLTKILISFNLTNEQYCLYTKFNLINNIV